MIWLYQYGGYFLESFSLFTADETERKEEIMTRSTAANDRFTGQLTLAAECLLSHVCAVS